MHLSLFLLIRAGTRPCPAIVFTMHWDLSGLCNMMRKPGAIDCHIINFTRIEGGRRIAMENKGKSKWQNTIRTSTTAF